MEPQPEPAADETFRYKVIKSGGATLYNDAQNTELSKFKQRLRDVTLPVDTIFTGSQPNADVNGWVQITGATKAEYTGKYLKSRKQGGERVITPLIDFDISNLEGRASALNVLWGRVSEPQVVMVESFEPIIMQVEEYKKEALALRDSNKVRALQLLKLKNNLLALTPMLTERNIKRFKSILSVKRQIIKLGDEWLIRNTKHTVRLDCGETEIRDCLEKCKLSAENFSQDIIDFLDIYLSLKVPITTKVPRTTGGGGAGRARQREAQTEEEEEELEAELEAELASEPAGALTEEEELAKLAELASEPAGALTEEEELAELEAELASEPAGALTEEEELAELEAELASEPAGALTEEEELAELEAELASEPAGALTEEEELAKLAELEAELAELEAELAQGTDPAISAQLEAVSRAFAGRGINANDSAEEAELEALEAEAIEEEQKMGAQGGGKRRKTHNRKKKSKRRKTQKKKFNKRKTQDKKSKKKRRNKTKRR